MSSRILVVRRSLICVLLVLFVLVGCNGSAGTPSPRARPIPSVTAERVTVRTVDVEVEVPIELRALAEVEVLSRVVGYLESVVVDRSDVVRRGDLIATVRPSDLPNQLSGARGSLAQAQASVALARVNLERAQQMASRGFSAQQELDNARGALATTTASERSARAQVEALSTRLRETRIEAPFNGVVSLRRLDPGALVGLANSGPIVTIVQTEILRVVVAINQRMAPQVRVGQTVRVRIEGMPTEVFTSQILRLSPDMDSATRTLDAEVHLDNRDGRLRPGMYGRASVVLAQHPNAIVVPVASVQITTNGRFVFVLEGDRVRRRRVQTGVEHDDWIEVTQGLLPHDLVVTAGADSLADGAQVRAAVGVNPFDGPRAPTDAGTPTQTPSHSPH